MEAGSNRCEVELTKVGFIEINDVPVADFSYGLQGREIFFIDQSLRADEYSWKFGDGEFSEESNLSMNFQRILHLKLHLLSEMIVVYIQLKN
ncbi:MAG: PKD domain-containing protein [Saprospiraceae bacterium]|nr:PKD domain-containing protein [Saprospiraceae bacterium]